MLSSIGISPEELRCEAVCLVGFPWRWNKRYVFHPLDHTLIRQTIPMVIGRIRLQVSLVAGFSDGSQHARFFGGFYVGSVAVVSRQIVVHHVAHFVERG